MYLLTITYRQRMTRIQCGCTNDATMDMLQYAADRNMFVSFVSIHAENLPERGPDELDRVDRFVSEACFNQRVLD
jgi:hypothetical protein